MLGHSALALVVSAYKYIFKQNRLLHIYTHIYMYTPPLKINNSY